MIADQVRRSLAGHFQISKFVMRQLLTYTLSGTLLLRHLAKSFLAEATTILIHHSWLCHWPHQTWILSWHWKSCTNKSSDQEPMQNLRYGRWSVKQLDSLICSATGSSGNHFDEYADYANLIQCILCRLHRDLLMQWLMRFKMLRTALMLINRSHQLDQMKVVLSWDAIWTWTVAPPWSLPIWFPCNFYLYHSFHCLGNHDRRCLLWSSQYYRPRT